jgi:dihydroorotate dehydrogenase (NAD+) catalytic subunit
MGGIASLEHVRQYARAGADLFGIGSALTGLNSAEMRLYLAQLEQGGGGSCETRLPMDYFKTRIRSRVDYDEDLFKLILEELPQEYSDGGLAGKFFFLWAPGVGEKPFAIFSASEKSIVVRVVGEFTRRLSELSEGAEILLRGPYGSGVAPIAESTVVHVGGGTGIASLLEIAEQLHANNRQLFLLGARTRAHLFDLDAFRRLGPVFVATDDGSLGHHGFIPELIPEAIAALPDVHRSSLVFINCGPEPMVRRCFDIQREFTSDDRILASIEYMTSCGVGICGKCASPSGALTCIDGPFLPLHEFLPLGA